MRRAALCLSLLVAFLTVAHVGLAQTATPAPAMQHEAEGTRTDPIPRGQSADISYWRIEIVGYRQNANEIIAAIPLNDPPAEGRQFVMATFKLTNTGTGNGSFLDLDLGAISALANASDAPYSPYSDSCGVVPDDPRTRLSEVTQIPPGGTVKVNICWSVKTGDANGLLITVRALSAINDAPLFFDPRKA